jgi:hypothetical protein
LWWTGLRTAVLPSAVKIARNVTAARDHRSAALVVSQSSDQRFEIDFEVSRRQCPYSHRTQGFKGLREISITEVCNACWPARNFLRLKRSRVVVICEGFEMGSH